VEAFFAIGDAAKTEDKFWYYTTGETFKNITGFSIDPTVILDVSLSIRRLSALLVKLARSVPYTHFCSRKLVAGQQEVLSA